MRIIELDANRWTTPLDFLSALKSALGCPPWHGDSPDAFVDSMVWGGINSVEPPYTIQVIGTSSIPREVIEYVSLMASVIREAREERYRNRGDDIDVSISATESSD